MICENDRELVLIQQQRVFIGFEEVPEVNSYIIQNQHLPNFTFTA